MIDDEASEAAITEGKTVDEAIRRGLIATGWSRDQVTVEVVDPGSRTPWVNQGLARVRLSRKTADPFELADRITAGILRRVGLEGRVSVEQRLDHIRVLVQGEGLEKALVAEDGEGLDALQHLVSRIVSKRSGTRQLVNVDLGGYRERKERQLRDMAYQLADEVRQTGRKVLTDAMAAAERRVIHLALNEDPDITTFAIGDGLVKPIAIAPIDQAPPPEERRPSDRRWSGGRGESGMRGEGRGDGRGEGRGRGRMMGGRGGQSPRRSSGGSSYGGGRPSGGREGERGVGDRPPRRSSRYDDRAGGSGPPPGARGPEGGDRPYRQAQGGRGPEPRRGFGDRREGRPVERGGSGGNVERGRGYPPRGADDDRSARPSGGGREAEGSRGVSDRRPPLRQSRGGRGRGAPEGRGSEDDAPINRSHINLDRDLWDPIGDADLIEPEVDEFEPGENAIADDDAEEREIDDEGVEDGEIEDDDEEGEIDDRPGAGGEIEDVVEEGPVRDVPRPASPGTRRDPRGRGRTGGRRR
jgi:spoIIIJ-associated protein